jgi:hypothetical protein
MLEARATGRRASVSRPEGERLPGACDGQVMPAGLLPAGRLLPPAGGREGGMRGGWVGMPMRRGWMGNFKLPLLLVTGERRTPPVFRCHAEAIEGLA